MKKSLCVVLLAVGSGGYVFPAPPPAAAQPEPVAPKTHVLYMGVDLDWQQGKEFHRVSAIRGRTAVVRVDGREREVRMGKDHNNFKVVNSLKLGKPAVQVDQVKLDRFFTPQNDPQKRFLDAVALSTAAMDETMAARYQDLRDQHFITIIHDDTKPELDPDYAAKVQASRAEELRISMETIDALSTYTLTTEIPSIDPTPSLPPEPTTGSVTLGPLEIKETDVAVPAQTVGSEAEKVPPSAAGEVKPSVAAAAKPAEVVVPGGEWYDAFELKFEVSSEKPIAEPYVVIVINYTDPRNPQQPRQWVHAQQIDPIGPKSSVVRLRYAGLPPGFLPKSPRIHVFDGGRELATVAPGSMLLTRAEASEYALLEYLSKNKKGTLPPTPLLADLPADLAQRMSVDTFPKVVFVEVDAKGRAGAAFADEGRRRRIDDATVVAVLREIRFGPALDKGKAVPGLARVAMADIPL